MILQWKSGNCLCHILVIAVPKLERITGNEEMGRYAFSAKNDNGDMIECTVNTPGEWNIPLINITGYTTARYRNIDL